MNARKIWTELFQKPAGRLVLFLLVGGIFLAFILTAAGAATEAGQHARRQPGHSGKELFLQRGHPAAVPDPGHAISAGARKGCARHTDSKAAATHPADHLRDERTIRQRILSAVWPAASLRAGEHGGFHQHRHADHRPGHRGRMERRARDHPGGHGGSWRGPEVSGSRAHRFRTGNGFWFFRTAGNFPSPGPCWITRPTQRIRTPGRNRTAPRACADSS